MADKNMANFIAAYSVPEQLHLGTFSAVYQKQLLIKIDNLGGRVSSIHGCSRAIAQNQHLKPCHCACSPRRSKRISFPKIISSALEIEGAILKYPSRFVTRNSSFNFWFSPVRMNNPPEALHNRLASSPMRKPSSSASPT